MEGTPRLKTLMFSWVGMKSKPLKASDNAKQSDSIDGIGSVGETVIRW